MIWKSLSRKFNVYFSWCSLILIFVFSCLRVIRCLQSNGHIPAESTIFKKYSQYVLFGRLTLKSVQLLLLLILLLLLLL